ncbi:response regulator [Virgibacillus profundi]|uniref:Response regulator n=1 Tax=Virgibacillus profundi TaxID=2024555 RepID=A0A2A2IIL9_9BACI|nr:response regulator [Virgibacillus profundi]PAV31382.1 response regulator [Virgibacillus profundi]PXY55568.1 response regulator [Virgibacillus profundi]
MAKEILVVDDQPGICLLLTDILENEGYIVYTANTGKQALDKVTEHLFDLIILDYKLPILDGTKVLQRMEAAEIHIPAILMSGLAEDIIKEAEHYSSVKNVLPKPFNVMDVCNIVKSIIG